MEQELKREYLLREGLAWWGLFDESRFEEIHKRFLAVDEKLEATAMDYTTIADELLSKGIVRSRQAANATANIAMQWMHSPSVFFDFSKTQMAEYRARLNKIGMNIAQPYDITRHTAVLVRRVQEINTSDSLVLPDWYRHAPAPRRLQLVAA